jgi:hypothetical protein
MDGLNWPEFFQANSRLAKHVKAAKKGFVCGAATQTNL